MEQMRSRPAPARFEVPQGYEPCPTCHEGFIRAVPPRPPRQLLARALRIVRLVGADTKSLFWNDNREELTGLSFLLIVVSALVTLTAGLIGFLGPEPVAVRIAAWGSIPFDVVTLWSLGRYLYRLGERSRP